RGRRLLALGGRCLGEHRAHGRELNVALFREPLDELARDDLFDRARGALHLDAVIALEQRRHFLARGAEQFRNLEDPNSCQTMYLYALFASAPELSPRTAARILSAVFPPIPGIADSCSRLAPATASCVVRPASTSLRTVFSLMPVSVQGPGVSDAPGSAISPAAWPASSFAATASACAGSASSFATVASTCAGSASPPPASVDDSPGISSCPNCASTSRRFSSSLLMSM